MARNLFLQEQEILSTDAEEEFVMRNRCIILIALTTVMLVFASAAFAQRGRSNCSPPAPSVPHDPHDLSGVWSKGMGETLSCGEATPPLFTPLGKQRFRCKQAPRTGPDEVPPALGNDPTGNCDPLGLVRNLLLEVSIYQMEIVPTPKRILQFFEWAHSWREIWIDGLGTTGDPDPTWMG